MTTKSSNRQPRGDALLQPAPRDEARIIARARQSGMFPADAASKRAALLRHLAVMQQNAEMRTMRERRRSLQEAQSRQMDYERTVGEEVRSRIEPLRTFRHQMNDRERIANSIMGQAFIYS